VGLSVRGELRYVVMEADADQRLRECELEIALQEARAAISPPSRSLSEAPSFLTTSCSQGPP